MRQLSSKILPSQKPVGPAVQLYSDGACNTTKRTGGWATILRCAELNLERTLSGNEEDTTNNRMELMGLLSGLRSLKKPCVVEVYTDSQYLLKAFAEGWLLSWQRNGWKTSGKTPVKNQDLWEELIAQAKTHHLVFCWVKGHSGHDYNERVDTLAVAERKKLER